MTKFYLLFLVFISIGLASFAQESDESFSSGVKYPREKHILSLSLLSQLDINNPSIQVALEHKITEWLGIHQELGFINNWLNPFYTFFDNQSSSSSKLKNGVKYIVEPRFYPLDKDELFGSRFFIAPSFNFRYVNIKRDELVFRFNNAFQQQMQYDVNKIVFGGMLKVGFTTKLRKAMPIQMVFGLGARSSQKFNNLPEDAERANGGGFFFDSPRIEGTQWHPDAYFGMLLQLHDFQKKK